MTRRELAQTLFDLAALWEPCQTPLVSIAPRSLLITQPIEVRMKLSGDTPTLFADAPSISWQTVFDGHSGAVSITFEATPQPAALIALADFADGRPV